MEIEPHVSHTGCGQVPVSIDSAVAALAGAQHGTVARWQLLALGLTARQIEWRVKTGRLHVLFRGVYAVGHRALSRDGQLMAATLVAQGALLSHRSAAEQHRILPRRPGPICLTTPTRHRPQPGLLLTESVVEQDEREAVRGIPVTTVARTILDLAATEDERTLDRALREAEVNLLADETGLQALIARHPGRRGVATLRRLTGAHDLDVITRSELEARFRRFLTDHRLPPPLHNTAVGPYIVDALWPQARLVVELDGYRIHGRRRAFEDDRRRDRALAAAGYTVIRITWRQLREDPAQVALDVRSALTLLVRREYAT